MKILSIETSCDETAISLLSISKNKIEVLGDALHSQIELHAQYGGVFPMMAKREHQKNLCPLLIKTLKESQSFKVIKSKVENKKVNKLRKILERETDLVEHFVSDVIQIKKPNIDVIAVTKGPGLEPALWVGISFAKALSELWGIPVIGVNHMEGHIVSVLLNRNDSQKAKVESEKLNSKAKKIQNLNVNTIHFPALSLLVSGGHTELVLIKDWGKYEIIGKTKDDAVGEAFDKVARILGLPYPGGPEISKLAEQSRNLSHESQVTSLKENTYALPRPMMHTKDFDFSFSGLKTAVLYMVQKIKAGANTREGEKQNEEIKNEDRLEIAREFEDACVDVLIHKTKKAIEHYGIQTLIVGGGVSANKHLRANLETLKDKCGINLYLPEKAMATDNAIMIAIAGYLNVYKKKKITSQKNIKAEGHLSL